jgi:coenzyme F420-reducing hydrogenase delta subunit/NAD-dependent dihydropyrimidine dehydrogenase PreA subunit
MLKKHPVTFIFRCPLRFLLLGIIRIGERDTRYFQKSLGSQRMTEQLSQRAQLNASVRIDDDFCGRCTVCSSICPFDAIAANAETSEVKLDIEKCQVCGLCSSACPASAIETIYYNDGPLLNYIDKMMQENSSDKLVLTCRGSGPSQETIENALQKTRLNGFVPVILPCVGRVPPELLLKALGMGIKNIIVMPCEDDYCRFKNGSIIAERRLLLVRATLNQLGFEPDALTVFKHSIKAHIDSSRCIGCGNCSYTCPYDAITMGTQKVAELNPQACSGCGACAAVCPSLAVGLDGFDHESISQTIRGYGPLIPKIRMKTKKPAILVLSCQWSEFSDFDPGRKHVLDNAVLMGLPCAGRVDDLHVLEAFYSGFDGVLIGACNKNECKLEKGNERAEQRLESLKRLLAEVNLGGRLQVSFVSPRNPEDLNDQIRLFTDEVRLLLTKEAV